MAVVRFIPKATVVVALAAIIAAAFLVGASYRASGNSHNTTYYACLYGGTLSQVNTTPVANCGRGTPVSWNAQGIQGQPGIQGQQGVPGPPGVGFGKRRVVTKSLHVSKGSVGQSFVICDAFGETLLDGGYVVAAPGTDQMVVSQGIDITANGPASLLTDDPADEKFWIVGIANGSAFDVDLRLYAICVTIQ